MGDDMDDEKISVRCKCGKGYRVSSKKAGKRIPCKACGERIKIPGKRALSTSSRGHILRSVGIDPDAAEKAWEDESSRPGTNGKSYKCSRCAGPLESSELKGAYVQGELVCSVCREGLEDRREAREGEKRALKKNEIALVSAPSPERAKRLAMIYGSLFFVGFFGPLWAVAGVRVLVALAVAAVVAAGGGWFVFRKHS